METLPTRLLTKGPEQLTPILCNLKIVPEKYENPSDVINVLQYVPNKSYDHAAYGIGCPNAADEADRYYKHIREIHNITEGSNLRHYIVGFDYSPELINTTTLPFIAYQIALFFYPSYQVFYGIHEYNNTRGQYHIHFVVNTINILTGTHIPRTSAFRNSFRDYVNNLTVNGNPLNLSFANDYV